MLSFTQVACLPASTSESRQAVDLLAGLKQLVVQPHVGIFFLNLLTIGACFSLVENLLFLRMDELHASNFLCGLSVGKEAADGCGTCLCGDTSLSLSLCVCVCVCVCVGGCDGGV